MRLRPSFTLPRGGSVGRAAAGEDCSARASGRKCAEWVARSALSAYRPDSPGYVFSVFALRFVAEFPVM